MHARLLNLVMLASIALAPPALGQPDPGEGRLGEEVDSAVAGLLADRASDRQAQRQKLLDLAAPSAARAERVLSLLPELDETMPPALVRQLNEIRVELEKQIAESAIKASRVTLDTADAPLAKVFSAIELATGNRLLDNRAQFGQQADEKLISLQLNDAPFWEAMDQVLDQAGLDVYEYSGEDALALVAADQGVAPRAAGASYAGPFRVAATSVLAERNLRLPSQQSLSVNLQIAWEPRLRPIALSQQAQRLAAVTDRGDRLQLKWAGESINLELSHGNQATDLRLPFELPPRGVAQIATLRGTLQVLAPGRNAKFRFNNLQPGADPTTKQQGGVAVTLAGVRQNNAIWEVHMRLRLDQPGEALASHRGWVYDNRTYLLDQDGQQVDHAGFETTMQTEDTIGLAYLFDREDGVEGLTWVYETPASVHRFPVEYELKAIPLP